MSDENDPSRVRRRPDTQLRKPHLPHPRSPRRASRRLRRMEPARRFASPARLRPPATRCPAQATFPRTRASERHPPEHHMEPVKLPPSPLSPRRRPDGEDATARRQVPPLPAVCVHDMDLPRRQVAAERELSPVWRPSRSIIWNRQYSRVEHVASISIHDVDPPVADYSNEHDPSFVG